MEREMMEELLLNLVRQIAFIPTDELQAHVDASRNRLQRADSFGAILDPTYYRNSMHDGTFDNARRQLKMAECFLAVRMLIDEHEAQRQEILAKQKGKGT